MHYNKQILESHHKVKTVWKTVITETRKYPALERSPSIKETILKLTGNSFSPYFLITVETLNNSRFPAVEKTVKYMSETVSRTSLNIDLLPVTSICFAI
jgi:hypothetical protein